METNYWQLGTWRRVPVSMHWTVLIAFAWLYLFFFDLLATAIASVAFFALLVAHELGHVVVLRRRKIAVASVELFGIHGRTSHAWASATDEIRIAWGGVGAQMVVLVLALGTGYALEPVTIPIVWTIAGPILFVLTKLNIFLMLIALLPIGPFDGHAAWAVIPRLRKAIRGQRAPNAAVQFPERDLPPDKLREFEESSTKAAAELLEKLGRKGQDRKEDA
jgi:Zn-dependent protease